MRTSLRMLASMLFMVGTIHAADRVPAAAKKLDAYLDGLQQQNLVSGSLAISERGALRYRRSLGFSTLDAGTPQPADEGTRYRIGGVTQLFTAVLVLQLAEGATLTLDNPLAEFFPDEPNALHVTYRQMLRGQSGLDARANYRLLGRVVEKVRERPYADVLRRQITDKLALVRTYYAGTGNAATLESRSYRWTDDAWIEVPNDDPAGVGAAGALVSNAGDLVTFMDAIVGGRIVTRYTFGAMRDDENTGARIALQPLTVAGETCLGVRGQTAAFDAFVCHFAGSRITLAWTGNATRIPVDQMLDEIGRIIFRRAG